MMWETIEAGPFSEKRRNESRDDKRKRERAERKEAAGGRNRRM